MLDLLKDHFDFIENEYKTKMYCKIKDKLTKSQIKNISYEVFEKYLNFIGVKKKPEKLKIICWISEEFKHPEISCVQSKFPLFELVELIDIKNNTEILNETKIQVTPQQKVLKIKIKKKKVQIENIYNELIEKDFSIEDIIEGNIIISKENEDEYILTTPEEGYIRITDSSIVFYKPLILENVNMETGNICYCYDVIVNGDVITGFELRSGGDVLVKGVVEAATIIADGNIMIEKPIMGMNKAKIVSAKNINLVSANKSHIIGLKDIKLEIELINCEVICSGNLIGSKNSRIISGSTIVYGNIKVGTLGSKDIIKTKITAGISPFHIDKLINTEKTIKKINSKTDILKKNKDYLIKEHNIKIPDYISTDLNKCAYLHNMIMENPDNDTEIIKKIAHFFFLLNNYKEILQEKNDFFKNLRESIINKENISINVVNKIYQNVIINIKGYKKTTEEETEHKKIYLSEDEIKIEDIGEA